MIIYVKLMVALVFLGPVNYINFGNLFDILCKCFYGESLLVCIIRNAFKIELYKLKMLITFWLLCMLSAPVMSVQVHTRNRITNKVIINYISF